MNNKIALVPANRWPIASLIAGVGFSVAACWIVAHFNQVQREEAVTAAAETAADGVVSRIELYQYGLRGARGAIQTMASSQAITREGFDLYSKTRNVDEEFPGARGFGFIRRVPLQDEAEFLTQAQVDGWPEFAIRQIAPHQSERYIIQYINPVERNLAAIGLDIASEANRRQAALSSMRSGEVRLTGPITLVQATGKPQQSFLILMPIFRSGSPPDTPEAREAQTLGWSYAALSIDAVLNGLRPPEQAISLKLQDVTDPEKSVAFYSSGDENPNDIVLSRTVERDVYGRRWQLRFEAHPPFIRELNQLSPLLVLSIGVLFSMLMAALMGALNISRKRRRSIIAEQAKLAAIVESSADGIIGMDRNGKVTSWNKGAEELFGYSTKETLGQRIGHLIMPEQKLAEEENVLACIQAGKSTSAFETQRQHKNGTLISVSVTMSPIFNSEGRVIGGAKTVRDISERVAADAQIHKLNSSLEAQVAQRTSELLQLNVLLGSVLSSASEVAIIATDLLGVIKVFNTGAERILGYEAADVIDQHNLIDFHTEAEMALRANELTSQYGCTVNGFCVLVHEAERHGADTREWTYCCKGGVPLPVSVSITAMYDDHGDINGYLSIAVDLTTQKASESAVSSARDQLLMAADAAELGIWSWGVADNSLSWNARMFQLYGLSSNEVPSGLSYQHWHERLHPDDMDMADSKLQSLLEKGEAYNPVFRVVRPDGTLCTVQAGAQVERDEHGTPIRVTGINRDITAQLELQTRLQHAKEQADAASAAKSSFVANMSHEIRTPMNAVLGMLQLVQNTELNTRQLDYISKAESAAKSLLGLLNDILDYSKIDAGKLQLDIHVVDLENLMRDLAIILAGNLSGKDVEVMFDIDPQLPSALYGDGLRLQQVLVNLAGNALKFTQHGHVVVKVGQRHRQSEEVRLRVEVIDSGIGISPEHLKRIFDGFTQAEASISRRFGGTGLGLVISQRLIELMGGELQVSSQVGIGSCFWFDINMRIAQEPPLGTLLPGADHAKHLLVVDDNEVAGELLVRMTQSMGWQVDLVRDGRQAVDRVQQMQRGGNDYDIILMDWRMPELDGLSAARKIHQQSLQKKPPIIMITACGQEVLSDSQQLGDAPFVDILSKPVTPQQLINSINNALISPSMPQPTASNMRSLLPKRLEGLRFLVVEDNMLNREVAFELLTQEGAEVTLAEGGLEGVTLATKSAPAFDAVLMDIQMPDIDGLEATRLIRADGDQGGVKIIAMTANASEQDKQACYAAGMDDHLSKPVDLERLIATLLSHTTQEVAGAEVAPPPTESINTIVEPESSISRRFGGNYKLIRTMLGKFADEQTKQLRRLKEAFEQGDRVGAISLLHAIKGSSATMGATAFADRVGAQEQDLRNTESSKQSQGLNQNDVDTDHLFTLLQASDGMLRAMFDLPVMASTAFVPVNEDSADLSIEQWHEALRAILQLLEVGSLQAIEKSESLQGLTPQAMRSEYDAFLDLVRSLDFAAALLAGHDLLHSN